MPAFLRICLFILCFALAGSLSAQTLELQATPTNVSVDQSISPGGQPKAPPAPGGGPVTFATTQGCPEDTVQYTVGKLTGTTVSAFIVGTNTPAFAQYYDAPDDLTVHGMTFFSGVSTGAPGVTFTATVYEALPDSSPGIVLAQTTGTITNFFGGLLISNQYDVTFPTPASIPAGTGYLVAVELNLPTTTQILFASNNEGNGLNEDFAFVNFPGFGWFKTNQFPVPPTFDRDMLFFPHVQYDQTADFTFIDTCFSSAPYTETFTNLSSPMIFHRMYNFNVFANTLDQSFEWNTGVSTGVNTQDHTETFPTVDNYSISLTDTILGWTSTCIVTETKDLFNEPTTDSVTGPDTACVGDVIQLFAFGTNNANNFSWTVPSGWTILSGQNTSTLTVQVGTASGDVCATAINGPCVGEQECHNVFALSVPFAPSISGPSQVCPEDTVNYFSALAPNVDSLVWGVSPNWELLTDSTAINAQVATDTLDGFLTLRAFNRCGVSPVSTYNVSTYELPDTVFPVQGPSGACNGQFVTFFTQSVANVTNYSWLYPADWQVFGPDNATSITFQTGALEGEVCVITTLFGCLGDTVCTTVELDAPIADPTDIEGERGTCEFVEQTYSIAPISGAQDYEWEIPSGWGLLSGQGTNEITVAVGSSSGAVCVRARNGVCYTDEECAYINVGETVGQINDIFGNPEVCFDDSVTFEVDNVLGADRYTWTWPTTWTLVGGQQTAILNLIGGLTFGELTVTPANAYCEGEPFAIDVIAIDKPEADFGWELIDDYEATFFDSSSGVPSNFFWDFDEGTTSIEVTPEHTFPEERIYNVTLIASNKCGSDTVTKEVPIWKLSSRAGELLNGYTLYPNPAGAQLMLSAEQAFRLQAVSAVDATGREIPLQFTQDNARAYVLDVSALAAGAYLLKVQTDSETGYARFVKQ